MKLPRNAQIWAVPYMNQRFKSFLSPPRRFGRVWICIADHFEPMWLRADTKTARARVARWQAGWPEIAHSVPKDSGGGLPQYTFFYPQEEYQAELLVPLAELKREGIADVEVHIHHDRDGREQFIHKIQEFCQILRERHGLLRERTGSVRFGFIHGNWALDNSLPGGEWCGLNDEIQILRDLGCYADFTMPSGDSPSQSRMLNLIYWCVDDPDRPKSYDEGTPVLKGSLASGDLMMITGPFGLRWAERLTPRLELGELAVADPPTAYRVRRWFELAPMIGTDVFIKLHTHGAQEKNSNMLLGHGLQDLFTLITEEAERRGCEVHYATAWELFLAVSAIQQEADPVRAVMDDRRSQGESGALATP